MHAEWTKTAVALPADGTLVEFMLDERVCPMRGVYVVGRFESRWNRYPPPSVSRWRAVAAAGEPARPAAGAATLHLLSARRRASEAGGFALAAGAA